MTWTSALRYVRAKFDHATPSADAAVPLGARINGLLQYQQTPLIKAALAGSIFDAPESGKPEIIKAISHVRLNMSGGLWRLQTVIGDPLSDDNRFVQVYANAQGELVEALLCSRLTSFVPTFDDVTLYQGVGERGLGDQMFTLWREQISGSGVPDAVLQAAMGERDRLEYGRDADPDSPFMAPFQGTETRIDDAAGTRGARADVWFMPYVRTLTDGSAEYLLIQLSVIEGVAGVEGAEGVEETDAVLPLPLVQVWIGLPIEKERITIQ